MRASGPAGAGSIGSNSISQTRARGAGGVGEVDERAAEAADRRDVELARADRLAEGGHPQAFGAAERRRGVADPEPDRDDRGPVHDLVRMRQALGVGVDRRG